MTSVEDQATSYDLGNRPHSHDKNRGKWAAPGDFYFSCITNSFGVMHFSTFSFIIAMNSSTILNMLYYFVIACIFTIPMLFIQTFLGQFSSSGYISVFRLAPFFKGIGYVILGLNFVILTFSSIYAAVPLFYALASFVSLNPMINCGNSWNTVNCTNLNDMMDQNITTDLDTDDSWDWRTYKSLATMEYYNRHVNIMSDEKYELEESMISFISWPILFCTFIVWGIISYVILQGIEWVGKFTRYATLTMMVILVIIVIRVFSMPVIIDHLGSYFSTRKISYVPYHLEAFLVSLFFALLSFGKGFGTTMVMASHNQFNSDIYRMSWAVVMTNFLLTFSCGIITVVVYDTVTEVVPDFDYDLSHPLENLFIVMPAVLGTLGLPNLWMILFFSMIFIAETLSTIIQLSALLTSFFDEFEKYRVFRKEVTLGLLGFFILTSIFYCTYHGYHFFGMMDGYQRLSQGLLFLFLIIIVLWVYGRIRFQRDVQFMIGKTFATAKIYMVRFLTPLFILLIVLLGLESTGYSVVIGSSLIVLGTLLFFLPWSMVSIYMVSKLISSTGSCCQRFKRCNRPTDWYPIDMADRQRYEATLGSSDTSHQLLECTTLEEQTLNE